MSGSAHPGPRPDLAGIVVVDAATLEVSLVAEGRGASWLNDHTLLVEV